VEIFLATRVRRAGFPSMGKKGGGGGARRSSDKGGKSEKSAPRLAINEERRSRRKEPRGERFGGNERKGAPNCSQIFCSGRRKLAESKNFLEEERRRENYGYNKIDEKESKKKLCRAWREENSWSEGGGGSFFISQRKAKLEERRETSRRKKSSVVDGKGGGRLSS